MAITFSRPSPRGDDRARGAGVTAVLGPTNTGKTHLAIERMLAHSSGVIGLPLRLLAREVYNKLVQRVGENDVALITGEEKIKPPNPRFWVSTVEAMPRDLNPAFLAIDEIQLATDFERGHVFTDRILNYRGRDETLILGAATMKPMVERLLPGANIISRPRLSNLSFAGEKKITRLPRRSAIVAFSADEVYAVAELIRRHSGGAAVVLGALSPRTRNAQVALFQSGDVDYMVATDAIGMGLNLDVDHVAFASDRKFDGYQYRKLNPSELAQIAGRAGRASRDGTFGTTGRCPPFDSELVQQIEAHAFEPVKLLQWRNSALDTASVAALQASLSAAPKLPGLTRAPVAEDILVLEHLARDAQVRAMARDPAAVARLWEVCQVPDYRKIAPATHAELAGTLFSFLMREGRVPDDWFDRQVKQADRTDGDIDTLSNRIAHVRTWTFIANRADWLADPDHWQDVTRAVEDKLSDALHERLTARFVDRRTSVLMRRLRENAMLDTEISKTGDVVVEGHTIGRLDGFTFAPAVSEAGSDAKALQAAAQKALAGEIDQRAARLAQAPDDQFVLANDGALRWLGQPVAKLIAGEDALKPRLRLIADEQLSGAPRDGVQARLELWLKTQIEKLLAPLFQLTAAEDVTGIARGVAFQLVEALGVLERQKIAEDVKGLDQPSRATLRKYGVRFGAYHIYLPALVKPAPRALASQLWALKQGDVDPAALATIQQLASSGRTSIATDKEVPTELYRVAGYRAAGERAVRVDILERLADLIRPALAWRAGAPGPKPAGAFDGRGFTVTVGMTSLAGCAGEDFASILRALGYRMEKRPKPPEPEVTVAEATPEAAAEAAVLAEGAAPEADAAAAEAADMPAGLSDADADTNADTAEAGPVTASDAATHDTDDATVETPEAGASAETAVSEAAPEGAALLADVQLSDPEPVALPGAEAVAVEELPGEVSAAAGPAPVSDEAGDTEPASADSAMSVTSEPEASAEMSAEAASEPATDLAATDAAPAVAGAQADASGSETADAAAAPSEPELVEVWRPGRPEGERRAHHQRRPDRGHGNRGQGRGRPPRGQFPDAAPAEGAAGEAVAAEGQDRRDSRPPRKFGRDGDQQRGDRPQGFKGKDSFKGKEGFRGKDSFKGGFRGRDDRRPSRGDERGGAGGFDRGAASRRDRAPDPDSPFAKLAALKAQLEGKPE
ncbi:MAG TPA: helicase-related protein [Xanthobacteraceae bacterium]|nr:helicase-related protein [Xanthobacteraceae bacterium]